MEEKFICSICHKKVKEVVGFMGSEIKYCYKCHNKKLEDNCAFLREYILNSFSMEDQKRFLYEACKGKYFEDVLNNFESKEVEQLKNNFDRLIVGIDLLQHGKDYRFRNENNTFYSRQSCCDLTLEETVKELLDELSQTDQRIAELEKQLKQQDTEILLLKKALMIATKRANRLNNHCDKLKGIYNAKFPYSDEVEYERAIKIAKKELNILEESNK